MAKIIVFHPSKAKRIKRTLKRYLEKPVYIKPAKD